MKGNLLDGITIGGFLIIFSAVIGSVVGAGVVIGILVGFAGIAAGVLAVVLAVIITIGIAIGIESTLYIGGNAEFEAEFTVLAIFFAAAILVAFIIGSSIVAGMDVGFGIALTFGFIASLGVSVVIVSTATIAILVWRTVDKNIKYSHASWWILALLIVAYAVLMGGVVSSWLR